MNNHEYTSQVTWIIMKHVTGDMNIHAFTSRLTYTQEYTSRVTYSRIHVTMTIFMTTSHGWLNIHEHTSRVTELWVHVMGDMNIQEYTSRVTWIFMSTRHRDMNIHDYTSRWTWIFPGNIHEWHILIPGFLIVPKSLGALPYWKVGLRYEILKAPSK